MRFPLKPLALGFCLLTFFQEATMAETQTFMDEVKAIRKKDRAAKIEIHDLAAKYVPVGTRKGAAEDFCKANGFKIYPPTDKEEVLLCSLHVTKWYMPLPGPGFKDEVRVTMRIKDGVVIEVKGFIFYHAL